MYSKKNRKKFFSSYTLINECEIKPLFFNEKILIIKYKTTQEKNKRKKEEESFQ